MKVRFLYFFLLTTFLIYGCQQEPTNESSDLTPVGLRCEYLENPLSIETKVPRLSWRLEASGRQRQQSAYQILVASQKDFLEKDQGDLWNSGKIESDESVNIPYSGSELTSEINCYWKVKVWDEKGKASDWSPVASWGMGLLKGSRWQAKWIGLDEAWSDTTYKSKPWANNMRQKTEYRPLPCPYLRKEFMLEEKVESAKIYITALGIYELYINGKRIGNDYFTPGWTDYKDRIYYNTYDIASSLQSGKNTIAVILADGWYAGNMANWGQYHYGEKLRLKAQIKVNAKGQNPQIISTDGSWKASYGPLREADMQGGETYDARLAMPGWNKNDFDDSSWSDVVVTDSTTAPLQAYPGVTVQKTGEIKPKAIFEQGPGVFIVDMGQNFAGWAKIKVKGERGQQVVMRFAEKLNADSTIHTRNLRTARCTDTYILSGSEEETWEPRFTYHGYQFIEVTGYPGELTPDKITGVVVHSNLPVAGHFSCSDPLINKIYSNIVWSQRSNYFDVPTDCPQRDERMGWTGDAQVFFRTASYNMDLAAFFKKWMVDVEDGMFDDGRFPSTAPMIYNGYAAGWGDAGVICPWNLYQVYRDMRIVEEFFPLMTGWMDYLEGVTENYIHLGKTYGDWQNADSETPKKIVATAYLKRSAGLIEKMALLLGKEAEAEKYRTLADNIRSAFTKEFVEPNGKIESNTQTAYLMALSFDLVPDQLRKPVAEQLIKAIQKRDNALSTGILGTNLLLPVLTELGELDLAYQILQNTKYPSWGFQINNGATTIWERWDSFSYEDGFHKDSTNSLNHYAYGSVGEWMFSTIAGIELLEPGYKLIKIHPQPGGGLKHAKGEYLSIRGQIASSWRLNDGRFELDVTIPANTRAVITIPTNDPGSLTESFWPVEDRTDFETVEKQDGSVVMTVGSGKYHFRSAYSQD